MTHVSGFGVRQLARRATPHCRPWWQPSGRMGSLVFFPFFFPSICETCLSCYSYQPRKCVIFPPFFSCSFWSVCQTCLFCCYSYHPRKYVSFCQVFFSQYVRLVCLVTHTTPGNVSVGGFSFLFLFRQYVRLVCLAVNHATPGNASGWVFLLLFRQYVRRACLVVSHVSGFGVRQLARRATPRYRPWWQPSARMGSLVFFPGFFFFGGGCFRQYVRLVCLVTHATPGNASGFF